MITIKPCKDEEVLGFKLGENQMCMVLRDNDNILGKGLYTICDGFATIDRIDAFDNGNAFFILKSILNSIDLMGIKEVFCGNEDLKSTLLRAGFKFENNLYSLNLEGYFDFKCKKG